MWIHCSLPYNGIQIPVLQGMWTGFCQNTRHISAPNPTIFKSAFGDLKKKKNVLLYASLLEGFEVQLNPALQTPA